MTGDRNRLGDAVALLMDAVTMMNNQGEIAQRINAFLSTIHPAECVELPEETPRPEGTEWTPPEDCVAWPVEKQTMIWAECEHNGEKHKTPFWIAPGTLLGGHPNMLRKAGAVQPKPGESHG